MDLSGILQCVMSGEVFLQYGEEEEREGEMPL